VPDQEDSNAREFAAVLLDIGGGRLHARLSDQLAEVTAAVKETGKKGLLTVKIEVKPVPRAENGTLIVTGSSIAKAPEGDEDSPTSIFFADDDGNLSRSDPRQPQLPFRDNVGGNR
jgi:hypothetical protein